MSEGWIGVDFDGTLAQYDTWVDAAHCGRPIQPMVDRVQAWLKAGRQVRVFTARVFPITEVITGYPALNFVPAEHRNSLPYRYRGAVEAAHAIQDWCRQYIGTVLPITCVKDYAMIELYDDRCVQVRPNTGELVGNSTRGLIAEPQVFTHRTVTAVSVGFKTDNLREAQVAAQTMGAVLEGLAHYSDVYWRQRVQVDSGANGFFTRCRVAVASPLYDNNPRQVEMVAATLTEKK